MTTPGIRATGLTKSYGDRVVIADLSLQIETGEFVALVGPSGAGKTTLLRCLVGLVEADRGEFWVAGHPIHAMSGRDLAAARRDISFVFQQFNLVRRLSAHRNAIAGRLAATPLWRVVLGRFAAQDRWAAHQALDRVGLADHAHRRVDQLSGGEQQRVAIARALVQGSRVLLADEPIASLDLLRAREVLSLLRSLAREEGLTILSALHQPDLAGRYADRVVALSDLVEVPRPVARPARTIKAENVSPLIASAPLRKEWEGAS